MKIFVVIFTITSFSFLTGCYTMVGVAEEERTYNSIIYENDKVLSTEEEKLTSGYFDEESEYDYNDEYNSQQNEAHYEESSIDFYTVFSDVLSGFISSGALNIVIDLSANSSSSSSSDNDSNQNTRNNTGSRNYDRR